MGSKKLKKGCIFEDYISLALCIEKLEAIKTSKLKVLVSCNNHLGINCIGARGILA